MSELDELRAAVQRVRELHVPREATIRHSDSKGAWSESIETECAHCSDRGDQEWGSMGEPWPCPTILALDGEVAVAVLRVDPGPEWWWYELRSPSTRSAPDGERCAAEHALGRCVLTTDHDGPHVVAVWPMGWRGHEVAGLSDVEAIRARWARLHGPLSVDVSPFYDSYDVEVYDVDGTTIGGREVIEQLESAPVDIHALLTEIDRLREVAG